MFSREICDKVYDQLVIALIIFVLIVIPFLLNN